MKCLLGERDMRRGLVVVLLVVALVLHPSFVLAQTLPEPPTNFTLTWEDTGISGTWTKGTGAINTIVRRGEAGYPATILDGTEVYRGTGTSFIDNEPQRGVDNVFYYSAWSHNAAGYSDNYAKAKIGGENMLILTITVVILALMTLGFVFKSGILFLSSTLGWVFFAFLMFNQSFANPAMNTGLLMFGGAMAFVTLFLALGMFTSGRRRPSPIDEQEAYKKQILMATRRRQQL